jgi:catechol 2,3-dioxygenase-like lactoylglutathione lyase family enzyme
LTSSAESSTLDRTVPITGILETALYAGDLGAAEDFYERVLGLELESRAPGRHAFFRCGEAMLLVFDPATTSRSAGPVPAHGATGPGHVAFAVDDIDEWPERLRRAGVAVEADFEWPGGGRSVYFRDPAGNSVELTTPRIWADP